MWLPLVFCLAVHSVGAAEIRGRVVDQEGKPVAQAVVLVQGGPATEAKSKAVRAVMDQVNREFVPRVLVVPVGAEVTFPNNDQIQHHVYSFSRARSFEIPLYKGEPSEPIRFEQPGLVKLGCNIHDWMIGYILVAPNSFFAVTAENGKFVIEGLPPGEHQLACWHEDLRGEVAETRKTASTGTEITFTLELRTPRHRVPVHGVRGYR